MSEPPETVLVVDDNEAERYFVTKVLRKAGFEVREAANGADALRLAVGAPDLITLDVRLPDISGFEVCRRLKSQVSTRDIPILHLSASFTTPEYKAAGLDGGADGYLAHPVDPTELVATVHSLLRVRRAEDRVRAAARDWTVTFDLIGDAVCLALPDGEIVRCNVAFASLTERPFSEIIGQRLSVLFPDLSAMSGGSEAASGEIAIGQRQFRVSCGPVGPPRVWVLGDVTEQRRAAEQLQEAHRLEAVGRLAGGVAHEANNQMTVVLGCANFALRQPELPRTVRDDLDQIRKAAERTAGITAQLLAFGRRQYVRPEMLDLNSVIAKLGPILQRALGETCALGLDLSGAAPTVYADIGQVEQVLLNLTLNARDAMPAGGTLTFRTRAVEVAADDDQSSSHDLAAGKYCAIEVSDTGEGMDGETMRRVFEPFFTTKPVGKGSGLGLSTVYGIVRQNNGVITVTSAPGAGTTFSIFLPSADPSAEQSDAVDTGEHPTSTRTILLVEDDPVVRKVLVRELVDRGARVLEACDGPSAIGLIREWQGELDAIVTDVRMPGMDGLELARQIVELRPGVPILFMSGHPEPDTFGSLAADRRPFLQKPFSAEELSRFIDRALETA